MRLKTLPAILALVSLALLSGCAELPPTGAPVDCTITELSGSGSCPAWIRQ